MESHSWDNFVLSKSLTHVHFEILTSWQTATLKFWSSNLRLILSRILVWRAVQSCTFQSCNLWRSSLLPWRIIAQIYEDSATFHFAQKSNAQEFRSRHDAKAGLNRWCWGKPFLSTAYSQYTWALECYINQDEEQRQYIRGVQTDRLKHIDCGSCVGLESISISSNALTKLDLNGCVDLKSA